MFAVVRTGGKQYRVAADQKITVDRLAGEVGDTVQLADVLAIGDGGALRDVAGQVVSAEIVAQPKGDKVIVFKKKRRHGYRRRNGHRQLLTVLKITAIGAAPAKTKAAPKAEAAAAAPASEAAEAKPAKAAKAPKAAKVEAAADAKPAQKPGAKKAPAKSKE
jgi:large subunit ribosomal protein L21